MRRFLPALACLLACQAVALAAPVPGVKTSEWDRMPAAERTAYNLFRKNAQEHPNGGPFLLTVGDVAPPQVYGTPCHVSTLPNTAPGVYQCLPGADGEPTMVPWVPPQRMAPAAFAPFMLAPFGFRSGGCANGQCGR